MHDARPSAAHGSLRERPRYALLGASGSIARWHIDAIRRTGGGIVAALDVVPPAPERAALLQGARVFTEGTAFEAHLAALRASGRPVDAVVVCTPNHLHRAYVALALENGADVICEKPVCLRAAEVDGLVASERTTGRRVHPILQMREHPALRRLGLQRLRTRRARVTVDYALGGDRGLERWRAEESASGGLVFELGIHSLDALVWLFGAPEECEVLCREPLHVEARLRLARADVRWRVTAGSSGSGARREMIVDGERLDLAADCHGLHRNAYAALRAGRGPSLAEARASIALAECIRGSVAPAQGVSTIGSAS